jgi:hypothetical protein
MLLKLANHEMNLLVLFVRTLLGIRKPMGSTDER